VKLKRSMNMRIQEDCRLFREFYPDPEVRHEVHYVFTHKFLPWYVHQDPYSFFYHFMREDQPGGPTEPTRFIHARWAMFERMSQLVPAGGDLLKEGIVFRRVSDLAMSTHEVAGNAVALVKMPKPEQELEAFFVAIALLASPARPASWHRDVQARVFTLEKEDPGAADAGVFCEWTQDGEHRNFALQIVAEPGAFLRTIEAALQAPEAAWPAGFKLGQDGATATITFRAGDPDPHHASSHLLERDVLLQSTGRLALV
jgi:hypothetical protein